MRRRHEIVATVVGAVLVVTVLGLGLGKPHRGFMVAQGPGAWAREGAAARGRAPSRLGTTAHTPGLGLLAAAYSLGQDAKPARAREEAAAASWVANPDLHGRLAGQWVSQALDYHDAAGQLVRGHHAFAEGDLPYIRFVSFWDSTQETVAADVCLFRWLTNQLHFGQYPVLPKEVPGTGGALLWLDLRWYDWNPDAWQAVGERDRYCVEPAVGHDVAEYLRRVLHVTMSERALKGREIAAGAGRTRVEPILPVVAVVSGSQLLRDILETERAPSYYDLLFARQRFVGGEVQTWKEEEVTEKKTIEHKGGDFTHPQTGAVSKDVKAGTYTIDVTTKKRVQVSGQAAKFVDFPATITDWEKIAGVDRTREFVQETGIYSDWGGVAAGGLDHPPDGSFVGLHDRLVSVEQTIWGRGYFQTFDVLDPVGVRDFREALIFGGKPFRRGDPLRVTADAGEFIFHLPAGGTAHLLADRKTGQRIEVAGNNVAFDQGSTTHDKRVRNPSCWHCHAPEGGFIAFQDVVRTQNLEGPAAVKFADPAQALRAKGFFSDQTHRVKADQAAFLGLVEYTTRRGDEKGWTGAELAKKLEGFRARYDGPLTLAQAAAAFGMPEEAAVALLRQLPLSSAQTLATGGEVGRRPFEVDLFPNLAILRAVKVPSPN